MNVDALDVPAIFFLRPTVQLLYLELELCSYNALYRLLPSRILPQLSSSTIVGRQNHNTTPKRYCNKKKDW